MAKAMSISAMVRAKGEKRRAAKRRAETLVSVAQIAGISFLAVVALALVGAVALVIGDYYSTFVF